MKPSVFNMNQPPNSHHRHSWRQWISTNIAPESAITTPFTPEHPVTSTSLHSHPAIANHHSHLNSSQYPAGTAIALSILTIHESSVSTSNSHNLLQKNQQDSEDTLLAAGKLDRDSHTEISHVTHSTTLTGSDSSHDNRSILADSPACPPSTEWEVARTSAASTNYHQEQQQNVLTELHECPESNDKETEVSCNSESKSASSDRMFAEKQNELITAFNDMFEQNGGTECVSRVKEIGDKSLATMRSPVDLIEAVEKELKDAKLKLDETLQRLACAARTDVSEVHSDNADASAAAEAVIEETKENNCFKDKRRWNASLLRDCSRLLAVFATKICASVLEMVERDKTVCSWSERVERIASVSSRGIPQLRIISKRFAKALKHGNADLKRVACLNGLVGITSKVADAAVAHVVQCVALAVAALQVELAERAYRCCA